MMPETESGTTGNLVAISIGLAVGLDLFWVMASLNGSPLLWGIHFGAFVPAPVLIALALFPFVTAAVATRLSRPGAPSGASRDSARFAVAALGVTLLFWCFGIRVTCWGTGNSSSRRRAPSPRRPHPFPRSS